jgi:hypothetical protein
MTIERFWTSPARRAPIAIGFLVVLGGLGAGCGSSGSSGNSNPTVPPPGPSNPTWAQWGQDGTHQGSVGFAGQALGRMIATSTFDPFVAQEQAERGGGLTTHYPAPLIDGTDIYMSLETGTWTPCAPPGSGQPAPCGPDAWSRKTWNEERLVLLDGQLVSAWTFASDWKPEPNGNGLAGWEPVFHGAIANGFVYVPGAAGTVYKLNRADGSVATRLNPFGGLDANIYVAGPLSADAQGNVYYNTLRLADPSQGDPWRDVDAQGSWLVKVTPGDAISKVAYSELVSHAPTRCETQFSQTQLPWPPSPDAHPPTALCGSQRPGVNVAPAIASDGTIYTVSRAHFNDRYGYVVAVNPDLTPDWAASLREGLRDGCGGGIPIGTSLNPPTVNACRVGTPASGVDPATNDAPAGRVTDLSSSSPTALPDGGVVYGAYTRYNNARGHLFKFSATGRFERAYDFGWDTTPAVYRHGGTYSLVIKDNHYPGGDYCDSGPACQSEGEGPYFITQLDTNLVPEWKFQNTETQSCTRTGGSLSCVTDHPRGFEWCVNAPAVDANGVVYANSEDGNVYAIGQGQGVFTTPRQRLFLQLALEAAYTPLALGPDGRIYAENDGQLFVVGN